MVTLEGFLFHFLKGLKVLTKEFGMNFYFCWRFSTTPSFSRRPDKVLLNGPSNKLLKGKEIFDQK